MRRKMSIGVVVLSIAVLATGCAKPPQQELDSAKASMSAAEQAEAPKYAPEAWAKAQEANNAVTAETQAQEGKFALFRSYNKTKELSAAAQKAADDAKAAAVAGKAKAKADAQAAIDAAKASLTSAADGMKALEGCKRKPKGFSKDMEAMKAKYDGLNGQVAGLDAQMQKEDYNGAKAAADALKSQVDAIVADMQAAKTKIKC